MGQTKKLQNYQAKTDRLKIALKLALAEYGRAYTHDNFRALCAARLALVDHYSRVVA